MIELNCPECGDNRFRYPKAVQDDSLILCETCGHDMGTFAHLKERIAGEVEQIGRNRDRRGRAVADRDDG